MHQDPKTKEDVIDHPPHYTKHGIEAIDVIEAWGLGFHLGNVTKYLCRWQNKGGWEDLKKAQWYLNRYIDQYPMETSHE